MLGVRLVRALGGTITTSPSVGDARDKSHAPLWGGARHWHWPWHRVNPGAGRDAGLNVNYLEVLTHAHHDALAGIQICRRCADGPGRRRGPCLRSLSHGDAARSFLLGAGQTAVPAGRGLVAGLFVRVVSTCNVCGYVYIVKLWQGVWCSMMGSNCE